MTAPAISQAFGAAAISAARQAGQRPDADRCVPCRCCRTDKLMYWLAACWLPLADCPGCQRRELAGGQVTPPDGIGVVLLLILSGLGLVHERPGPAEAEVLAHHNTHRLTCLTLNPASRARGSLAGRGSCTRRLL